MPKRKLPKEIKAKFNNRRWRIKFVKKLPGGDLGSCQDSRKAAERIIKVKSKQKEEDILDTLIHEMLHAIFPQLTEDAVYDAANDLSRTLYKTGYRLKDK